MQFEVAGHLPVQAQQLFAVSLGQIVEQGGGPPARGRELLRGDGSPGRGE
jgi:hypothetical protein